MEKNDFYVYGQLRLSNGEPFNVGKGRKNRCKSSCGRNKKWLDIVSEEGGFDYILLEENLNEKDALQMEEYWTLRLSYNNELCNIKNLKVNKYKYTREELCGLAQKKGWSADIHNGNIFKPNGEIHIGSEKYVRFGIYHEGIQYNILGHHFIWFIAGNNMEFTLLDHKNRNKKDNRLSNLRVSNNRLNMNNRDVTGVSFETARKKWRAYITVDGRTIQLGSFKTKEEALITYTEGKKLYHNPNFNVNDIPPLQKVNNYYFDELNNRWRTNLTMNGVKFDKSFSNEKDAIYFVQQVKDGTITLNQLKKDRLKKCYHKHGKKFRSTLMVNGVVYKQSFNSENEVINYVYNIRKEHGIVE